MYVQEVLTYLHRKLQNKMGQAFLDIQGNALILPPPRLSLLFLLPQIRGVGSCNYTRWGKPGKTQQLLWLNIKQYRVMISGGESQGKSKICQISIKNTIKLRFQVGKTGENWGEPGKTQQWLWLNIKQFRIFTSISISTWFGVTYENSYIIKFSTIC